MIFLHRMWGLPAPLRMMILTLMKNLKLNPLFLKSNYLTSESSKISDSMLLESFIFRRGRSFPHFKNSCSSIAFNTPVPPKDQLMNDS